MTTNILPFPIAKKRPHHRKPETLPEFRITDSFEKVTSLARRNVSEAFGLNWSAPLIIEFKDPVSAGKRDIHLRTLIYRNQVWKTKWMDRTVTPGFKRYGMVTA